MYKSKYPQRQFSPWPPLSRSGKVLALQNVANSSYHAIQATLRHASGPLTTGVSYSFSHSIDNSSDRSDPVLPNSYDLRQNRASSNFDQRHLLNISYVYQLPFKNLPHSFGDWAMSGNRIPTSLLETVARRW